MGNPNCRQCKHFFITFDARTPYGCRRFQMKSKDLPSVVVKMAGQGECGAFEAKADPQKQSQKDSLNDPRYW